MLQANISWVQDWEVDPGMRWRGHLQRAATRSAPCQARRPLVRFPILFFSLRGNPTHKSDFIWTVSILNAQMLRRNIQLERDIDYWVNVFCCLLRWYWFHCAPRMAIISIATPCQISCVERFLLSVRWDLVAEQDVPRAIEAWHEHCIQNLITNVCLSVQALVRWASWTSVNSTHMIFKV